MVERIAHVIGDGLHLGLDIVMREYHRVALGFELLDAFARLGGHRRRALQGDGQRLTRRQAARYGLVARAGNRS